jgi:hypothetical protein
MLAILLGMDWLRMFGTGRSMALRSGRKPPSLRIKSRLANAHRVLLAIRGQMFALNVAWHMLQTGGKSRWSAGIWWQSIRDFSNAADATMSTADGMPHALNAG